MIGHIQKKISISSSTYFECITIIQCVKGNQVVVKSEYQYKINDNKSIEIKTINDTLCRKICIEKKYQFLHKYCQEYYAAQKIIFGKSDIINNFNNNLNIYPLNKELGIIQFIADKIHG
ncbi:hypothetical protein RFI_34104 [Reticulomyxa filosa]|uniref:Uncharacterized protein n=1 Tax=Reticulomyxa filosa TaxID=46433 RepID=X6LPK9_RETFI|nr:hypothetical protein RFI_34104 [Reticulomyxa filosa]|eukprot:ETO03306.1 hypothetical protein RFI_34104 [Reticulomyxa filosa]